MSIAMEYETADVNGVKIFYRIAGSGDAVVLLHGFGQTGHMWLPLVERLAKNHTVIVPDLRGAGASQKPASGYDKKTLAQDIHALVKSVGFNHASIIGHDIGLMVAYAYAAEFPQETNRLVLMDAFLPGVGSWKDVWLLRNMWHFHFHGDVPLALVKGRERIYLEHFWNDFAADPKKSISEEDREIYADAYAQEGSMRAAFEYFKNLEQDAVDFSHFAARKLMMPVLVLTGERAAGYFLIGQANLVAMDVKSKTFAGAGHWLMEEATQEVISTIDDFLNMEE